VTDFQKAQGWDPSGVGPGTWKALDSIVHGDATRPPTGLIVAGGLPLGVGTLATKVTGPASGVFRIIARGPVTVANNLIPEATAVIESEAAAVVESAGAAGVETGLGWVAPAGIVVIGAIFVAGAIYYAVKLTSEAKTLDEFGDSSAPGGAPLPKETREQILKEQEKALDPGTEEKRKSCAPRLPHSITSDLATCTLLLDAAPQRLIARGKATTQATAELIAAIGSVSAVLSIVDRAGCLIGRATGVHDEGTGDHAEEVCMKRLAAVPVPPGSTLFATTSAKPCRADPGDHNCYGQLQEFALSRRMIFWPIELMGHRAKAHQ
jgi:hypothetical protein